MSGLLPKADIRQRHCACLLCANSGHGRHPQSDLVAMTSVVPDNTNRQRMEWQRLPSRHLSSADARRLILNRIKMRQRDLNPDGQAIGVPFIREPTFELTCDNLSCKGPAKSFSIWGAIDRRSPSLLPGHDQPVFLRRTVDVNNAG